MSLRLRFPFSTGDQADIMPGSVYAADDPPAYAELSAYPYPQTLHINLTVRPGRPAPQVRPLFSGTVRFVADPPVPPQKLPAWNEVTRDGFGSWVTTGRLTIELGPHDHEVLAGTNVGLDVYPNMVVYGRVQLTEEFLFHTIAGLDGQASLEKRPVPAPVTGEIYPPNPDDPDHPGNPDWWRYAIAGFLRGWYRPVLVQRGSEAEDDISARAMPTVLAGAGGVAKLSVSTAFTRAFQDLSLWSTFDGRPVELVISDSLANHGCVPAGLVLRALRAQLVGGQPGAQIPDAVLAGDWAQRYRPIRFRRSWQAGIAPEYSYLLARQVANVGDADTATPLFSQKIPAHGVLYHIVEDPGEVPGRYSVDLTGDARWLLEDGVAWRQPDGRSAVAFSSQEPKTVLVRDNLVQACVAEPFSVSGGNCVYRTLRRFVRALVDNRIAGGRQGLTPQHTDPATYALIDQALGQKVCDDVLVSGIEFLRDGRPPTDPKEVGKSLAAVKALPPIPPTSPFTVADASLYLYWLLRSFLYPTLFPSVPSPTGPPQYNFGHIIYHLWFTTGQLEENVALSHPFYDPYLGHGAPGALRLLGFADPDGYTFDPRAGDRSKAEYLSRASARLLGRLQPATMLQWWEFEREFLRIQARQRKGAEFNGHSLLYVRHAGANDPLPAANAARGVSWAPGIWIADQYREHHCPIRHHEALSTTLAEGVSAANTTQITLAGLPAGQYRRIRKHDELLIGPDPNPVRVVAMIADETKYLLLGRQNLKVPVEAFTPPADLAKGTAVTRPAYQTLTFSTGVSNDPAAWANLLYDVDIWIAARLAV